MKPSLRDIDIQALVWALILSPIILGVMSSMTRPTYHTSEYLEEYGPIIFDVVLAFPLVRTLRRFYIYYCNLLVARKKQPSLLRLPDELLFEVCLRVLSSSDCSSSRAVAKQRCYCPSPKRVLVNLSKTNKRMRNTAAPLLLPTIGLGKDYGWWRASRRLKTMENSLHVNKIVRIFRIDIYASSGKGARPPKHLPKKVAVVLLALRRLEKLVLVIPEHHTETFRKAFEDSKVALPNVRCLVLGPHMDWIAEMCPNVEVIATHDWRWLHSNVDGDYKHRHSFDLIKAAGFAEKLRHFEMMEWWERRHLWAIRKAMPNIQGLAMPGGKYNDGIAQLLPILAHLESLHTLVLAGAANLDVGFELPGCGNVYMGPGGDATKRSVAEEGRQAARRLRRWYSNN